MAFIPQSLDWPGTRAILMVHGIGDASTGKDGAFPFDVLQGVLADEADDIAIYRINYDFLNDDLKNKIQFQAAITAFKAAVKANFGSEATDATIAEYAGDVLWPVLSLNLRFAIRDALVAQLEQIHIDRGESALARGDDPLDYQVSIIAHSLGCFHTYEVLWAIANEPSHHLRPATDLFTFDSVVLMASPVQLIRSIAGTIGVLVPDQQSLATLAAPLAIPSETRKGKVVPCTKDFYSVTGTFDPVGGHLLGNKLDWAYMDMPGQHSVIVSQHALNISTKDGTANALSAAISAGGPKVNDPHSWTAYIEGQNKLLRGLLLT